MNVGRIRRKQLHLRHAASESNVLSMAMYSAIELGIFDIIAKAGEAAKLSAKDIAAQLPCKNSEAATMLDISYPKAPSMSLHH